MILYLQTAFLGDLLLSVPALRRLRVLYPAKKIHLLCRKNLGEMFLNEGLVDQVFDQFAGQKPGWGEVRETFKHQRYDVLVCPHQSFRSLGIAALIKADKKIGYSGLISRVVFDETVERPMKWPEALRQLALLAPLDPSLRQEMKSWNAFQAPFAEIPRGTEMILDRFAAKKSAGETKKTVLLAPGSVWATKRWGANKFAALARKLIARNHNVVLIGSPSERDISSEVARQVSGVTDLTGQTSLSQLLDIIGTADLLICNDSGAMHMASVVNTPTVAVFGPTVLRFGYQPWNPRAVVVENVDLKCRPCSSHGGARCPIGTHECMTSISEDRVLEKAAPYL